MGGEAAEFAPTAAVDAEALGGEEFEAGLARVRETQKKVRGGVIP